MSFLRRGNCNFLFQSNINFNKGEDEKLFSSNIEQVAPLFLGHWKGEKKLKK